MKKKFLTLLGGALLGLFSMSATAQTDVTSTYLVNPSFEYSAEGTAYTETTELTNGGTIYGWTLPTISNSNKNIQVKKSGDSNNHAFGSTASSEGNYIFYIRQGWEDKVSSLSQQVLLPAGKYYISADYKMAESHDDGKFRDSKVGFKISQGSSTLSELSIGGAVNAPGGSYFTNIGWKNIGTWFTVEEESTTKIEITMALNGTSKRSDLCLDNVKLYKWNVDDDVNYANASSTSPMDVTARFVKNPYFDSNVNDWTTTTGYSNKGRATNQGGAISGGFWENWNGSAKTSGKMYQALSGMPDGLYKLTAAVYVNSADANVSLYIGNKQTAVTSTTASFYSVTGVVSGGTAEIGLVLGAGNAANWIGLDNVKLEYLGYDATEALAALDEQIDAAVFTAKHSTVSETALQTAITAAQALVTAGTGTKTEIETASSNLAAAVAKVETSIADYANLSAQITAAEAYAVVNTANASDYEQAIADAKDVYNNGTAETCAATIKSLTDYKVADYTYVSTNFQYGVELGTWTTTGDVANFSNEHWSGTTHQYKNQDDSNGRGWNSSTGFKIGLNQDVTLPAGKYVFKACGRKSAGATMTLTVKNGDDVLGSVSDFPVGSAARGINTSGATSFDEGNDAYANNGNGYGWQWRFVPFELTEEATINVAVSASATTGQQWASFGDYSVLTDNDANIAMITYNVALNNAKLAIANDDYAIVTGAEKTALQNLIDADMTGKTRIQVEEATTALQTATAAFTAAAPAYDAYVTYMAKVAALDDDGKAKFAELESDLEGLDETTISVTVIESVPTSYTEALKAQTTPGTDLTGIIVNAAVTSTDGWNGSRTNTGEQYTDAPDNTYFDVYNETKNMTQNIGKLQPGNYSLKCATRASTGMASKAGNVYVSQNSENLASTNIHTDGNTNGELGNGWSWTEVKFVVTDATNDITIGFYSECGGSQWAGADNFSLTYLGDASANMKIYADVKWGTFVAPFDVTIPEGVEAYKCTEVVDGVITTEFVEGTAIPANTPVLVYSKTKVDETFYGKAVAIEGDPTCGVLVGTYADKAAPVGSYVLQKNNDVFSFYKVVSGAQPTVGANRCYLSTSSNSTVLRFGGVTGIQSMEQQGEAVIYDLTGRRVDAAVKGIYIVDGKKMLVK